MATIYQIPADLDIAFVNGDDWTKLFDFNINLTGYVFSAITSGGRVITVTDTNLALGQITLSMTDAVTSLVQPGETWSLKGTVGTYTRTYLVGNMVPQ